MQFLVGGEVRKFKVEGIVLWKINNPEIERESFLGIFFFFLYLVCLLTFFLRNIFSTEKMKFRKKKFLAHIRVCTKGGNPKNLIGSNVTGWPRPHQYGGVQEKIIHINNYIVELTSTIIFLNKKEKKKHHHIFKGLYKLKTLQENINNIDKMEKKKQWKNLEEHIY